MSACRVVAAKSETLRLAKPDAIVRRLSTIRATARRSNISRSIDMGVQSACNTKCVHFNHGVCITRVRVVQTTLPWCSACTSREETSIKLNKSEKVAHR